MVHHTFLDDADTVQDIFGNPPSRMLISILSTFEYQKQKIGNHFLKKLKVTMCQIRRIRRWSMANKPFLNLRLRSSLLLPCLNSAFLQQPSFRFYFAYWMSLRTPRPCITFHDFSSFFDSFIPFKHRKFLHNSLTIRCS